MKCAICGNQKSNKRYSLREMMFGYKDEFQYFQCDNCTCFQIEDIPQNMDKYYPVNYYSLKQETEKPLKFNYFKQLQYDYLSGYKKSVLGAIASFKYNPKTYSWFKNMGLKNKDVKILDVGCGNGKLLKQLFQVGFTNLTGIDPYLEKDIIYNAHLKTLKTSIFEIEGQFDIIMMHHSLEHMANQFEVLNRIYQLLNAEGKLLIRIPIMSEPLFLKYGTNMVFLDPPRHFFIHTIKSITTLFNRLGFVVKKTIYDAEVLDVITSEEYMKGISMKDSQSYSANKNKSVFSKKEIIGFKKYIHKLNAQGQSSSVALYIEKKPVKQDLQNIV